MEKKLYDLMNWPEIEGVIYSECVHPKAILGMHAAGGNMLIQTFNPFAKKAYILPKDGSAKIKMTVADEEGFFAALVPGRKKFAYSYIFEDEKGKKTEAEEIYNYPSMLKDKEMKAFSAGTDLEAYKHFGAHKCKVADVEGVLFTVWAPYAMRVSVVGEFCNWDGRMYQMELNEQYGVFELFIPGLRIGCKYQFEIRCKGGAIVLKRDPFGTQSLEGAQGLCVVNKDDYKWNDAEYMAQRDNKGYYNKPLSIFELYPKDFMELSENRDYVAYSKLADKLVSYVKKMNYTHVEFTPLMEHLSDSTKGYLTTGYFSPTGRYGTPDELRALIDKLHSEGIGVIFDWCIAQFPRDEIGLARFDGTCLFEHMDQRQGVNPVNDTLLYNYARPEVTSFLLSNAIYWCREFHIDGLKIADVATMLYLDYDKKPGEWIPNIYGGNENLDAIAFLKKLSAEMKKHCKGSLLIAEDNSCYPGVTAPAQNDGGLGFDYKWSNDFRGSLFYFMSADPLFRSGRYNDLLSSMLYAYAEKYILAMPIDTSLFATVPKDNELSNVKVALGYTFAHPGKKLLGDKYSFDDEIGKYLSALNKLYKEHPALYEDDYNADGFEWIKNVAQNECMVAFARKSSDELLLIVCNFTPIAKPAYKIGVPAAGKYKEIFNSDAESFCGCGVVNKRVVASKEETFDGRKNSIKINIPPMGISILRYQE